MKKILIIGGSHRDIPLIINAKELGYYTITLGKLSNYIGYRYSDKNFNIDFKDIEGIKKIIKTENIDYLVPGSGEVPMSIVTKLSKNGNYDSEKVFKILHSKDLFKDLCIGLNIDVPKGLCVKNSEDINFLDFPIIVKPLNLSGGKGITVVNNKEELSSAIVHAQNLSLNKKVVVEEFIEGDLIAYSIIFKDQKIIYSFAAQEFESNYYVTTTVRVDINYNIQTQLDSDLEKIAKKLTLKDGLLHVQFLLQDNKAKIIEVTRRIPGDLFPTLIDLSDGNEYSKAVLSCYLGNSSDLVDLLRISKKEYYLRYCVVSKENCIFNNLHIDKRVEVLHQTDIYESGEKIKKGDLSNIIIIKYTKDILENLEKLIYIEGL